MTSTTNKNLILLTDSFPFGAVAESFLDLELPYLSQTFDSIVIVPRSFPADIEKVKRVLPSNVFVDTALLNQKSKNIPLKIIKFAVVRSKYFHKEIFGRPQILVEISSLKRNINYLYEAFRINDWAIQYIKKNNTNLSQTIFYSYWLHYATLGISIAKMKYPNIKVVSRAHGFDLYEERYSPQYIPYRFQSLHALNHLYLISDHGKTYITERYTFLKSKCSLSRLGVPVPGFHSKPSTDGIFRVVSCSYIVPVKRLHLIILALAILGLRRTNLKIEWIHIGFGPLLEQMEKCACSSLPKNVINKFLGFIPNVLSYYQYNPVDLFINVSASEGIPVSIMEAQSCGIPVIATAVGGTPEIVSEKVGLLIGENPSPTDIADALEFFVDHPDIAKQMRLESIVNWQDRYDANKNFTEFVGSLKMM